MDHVTHPDKQFGFYENLSHRRVNKIFNNIDFSHLRLEDVASLLNGQFQSIEDNVGMMIFPYVVEDNRIECYVEFLRFESDSSSVELRSAEKLSFDHRRDIILLLDNAMQSVRHNYLNASSHSPQ